MKFYIKLVNRDDEVSCVADKYIVKDGCVIFYKLDFYGTLVIAYNLTSVEYFYPEATN